MSGPSSADAAQVPTCRQPGVPERMGRFAATASGPLLNAGLRGRGGHRKSCDSNPALVRREEAAAPPLPFLQDPLCRQE